MNDFRYSALFWVAFPVALIVVCVSVYRYFSYIVATPIQVSVLGTNRVVAQKQLSRFDPARLSWSEATSSAEWQPRDSAISFVFKNKLWTMGGINGNQDVDANHRVEYWAATHFNDIWTSDGGAHWELAKAHAAWAPRRSMSVLFFNDTLWMFGGWSPIGGYTSDIWQSADGVIWKEAVSEAAWSAREGQTAEVFQGKMWMFGGVNYDKREIKNDAWYSEDGFIWHEATTTIPWGPRWDHATTIFKGKLYLVGGMNLSHETFNDVWSSSDGLTWENVTRTPPWQTRQGLSLVPWHDMLWVLGRLNDGAEKGVNDVWYSSDGVAWQKTAVDPPWAGREDHSGLLFNDRLYVFGGMDADWRWRNDVWVSSN
jgi:hypothetical protein